MQAPELSEDPLCPGDAEPTSGVHFASSSGAELYGEWFEGPAGRPVAVVAHGYFEHCGRYREVAKVLLGLGLSVLTIDFRGHGRSSGQRGHVVRFSDYLDDLAAAFECADRQMKDSGLGDEPSRLLVAHSSGALVSLRLLADPWKLPPRIDAAVLSSPFLGLSLKVPVHKGLVATFASRFLPNLSLPNKLELAELTSDPSKQEARRVDTLCHDVVSARYFTEAKHTQEWLREFAPRIQTPTLWMVAGSDRIVDPSVSRAVQSQLQAPSEITVFEGMEHEIFNELDRGLVFARLQGYVEQQFGPIGAS